MQSTHSWTDLVVHIVWATKNRERLLLPAHDPGLSGFLRRKAHTLGCTLLAVGTADDHVHVAARYPAWCAVSTLVQRLKGASSREHNRDRDPSSLVLYWQDGFWAESCPPRQLDGLLRYVREQREHHAASDRVEPWQLALFPNQ